MNSLKTITYLLFAFIIVLGFYNCSSSKNNTPNFKTLNGIEEVYYISWVAGVKGGGSGINVFINVNTEFPKDIELDSIYFRGKSVKLQTKPNDKGLYIGYFKTNANTADNELLLDQETVKEEKESPKIPFNLKNNECVVSYIQDDKRMYYKITDIEEKETTPYPSIPQ